MGNINKIILMPDSFKGTISSNEICQIMKESINKIFPEANVISIPVADGGEGSVDCFLTALGGEKVCLKVAGPFFEETNAFYGLINDGRTAVIEMAACAGLPLAGDKKDPSKTTTYGVGQLMLNAVEKGCKEIIMGLGGSSTNDCGAGCAAAVGVRFYNKEGKEFVPTGGTLKDVERIDVSEAQKRFKGITITTMCDINNPMYGEKGAAYVFGPQKGANSQMVRVLDDGLKHISDVISRDVKIDVSQIPGGGAAGAMGAGMVAFFGSSLTMGIEAVLNAVGFEDLASDADIIFTGEGKLDSQSLSGKVVIGVSRRAKALNVPVIAVVGDIGDNLDAVYDMGVSAIFSINRVAVPFEIAKTRSKEDLSLTMESIMRLLDVSFRI